VDDLVLVERTVADVRPADPTALAAATREMDRKVKPPGSLGRLEDLAVRLAGIRGLPGPGPVGDPAVVVCAADHGVAAEQVSAYPREVTGLMLRAFASGGAAVGVLARQAGARLVVADLGVLAPPVPEPDAAPVLDLRVRAGTGNSAVEPAMSGAEAARAVRRGIDLASGLVADGVDLVALGEMGIGNTTTASAVTARLLEVPVGSVVGRGTGLDDAGVARKARVVERVLARHPDARDPLAVLAAMGGLEVAALTGVVLGCAARRVPVVLDGFITTAAALAAARLAPACTDALVGGHRSREPGHTVQLEALGLEPVLDLDLRLGEGSGAVLAVGVVRAAAAVLAEMATFADLGLGGE
jgi:nicotinate-nucleotide--dimethylbenzimidazole phosphoribosyltransferase